MLVQRFRRDLPGYDAFYERSILRHEKFSIAILRSVGLAIDAGVWQDAVSYLSRFSRTQLTIVVSGRGYYCSGNRMLSLEAGDAVLADQLRREREGYGGTPAEVLVLEWDSDHLFGSGHRGDARFFHLTNAEVARLRERVRSVDTRAPADFVADLCHELRALGFPFPACILPDDLAETPAPLVETYRVLGDALSRIHLHPSLDEVGRALAVSERQAHRRLSHLERRYAHHFSSWRAYLLDNRVEWTIQLLSNQRIPLKRVAELAGYRSAIAMNHALSSRGAPSPGALRKLLAQRWA